MKKIHLLLILFCFLSPGVKSQNLNQLSLRLSPSQFDLNFQRKLLHQKILSEAYIGISKQDINSAYDDIVSGIRIGTPLLSHDKNVIYLAASAGIYIPHNEYYKATTPVFGLGGGYTRYIGIAKRHSMLINLEYRYGERTYKQEYEASDISVATTGNFKLNPFHFSIGYGYNF